MAGDKKVKEYITLLPESMAKIGLKFVHEGASNLCLNCKLRRVCVEVLEEGRVYEVVNVRGKKHKCRLVGGTVRVVEVVEAPIEAIVPSKFGVEGLIFTFNPIECLDCELYKLCNPEGLKRGDKVRVEKVIERVPCEKKGVLVRTVLRRVY